MTSPNWPQPSSTPAGPYNGELAARINLMVVRGQEEARNHRPPSNATQPDQCEVELQAEAQQWSATECQLLAHALTDSSKSANQLEALVDQVDGKLLQTLADDSLQAQVAAELAGQRAPLVSATETRLRAEVELRHFQARHRITGSASYPDSKTFHLGVLLVLAFVETLVNSVFYAGAQGLLGGFVVALSVATVNMGGAVVLGLLFRYKNLQDREKRIGGWACLVAFVTLSIYCNALFAAFRAGYERVNPSDPSAASRVFRSAAQQAAHVFTFQMSFPDLTSFVLFGIGILLSLLAFYDGYTMDDKYPEHGKLDRKVKDARRHELELQEATRLQLKSFLEGHRHAFQALTREPLQYVATAGEIAKRLQDAHIACETAQAAIQRDFELGIGAYRNANASIRGTEAPPYFATIPKVTFATNSEQVQAVLKLLGSLKASAKEVQDRYQARLNQRLNSIQAEIAITLDTRYTDFLNGVEKEAEEAINRSIVAANRWTTGGLPVSA
jgi:hypothetical protein